MKKHGIDLAKFISRGKTGIAEIYTFDIPAFVKYMTENMEALSKIDSDKLLEDIGKIGEGEKFAAKAPAYAGALAVKGFESQWKIGASASPRRFPRLRAGSLSTSTSAPSPQSSRLSPLTPSRRSRRNSAQR